MHNPTPNRCLIFDLDTTLPFPTYFHKYVTETFRSDLALRPEHHRQEFELYRIFNSVDFNYIFLCRFFRVIPAENYLAEFSSDRRHMRRPDDTWIKPPPPYPPIQTHGLIYHECIHSFKSYRVFSLNSKQPQPGRFHLHDTRQRTRNRLQPTAIRLRFL